MAFAIEDSDRFWAPFGTGSGSVTLTTTVSGCIILVAVNTQGDALPNTLTVTGSSLGAFDHIDAWAAAGGTNSFEQVHWFGKYVSGTVTSEVITAVNSNSYALGIHGIALSGHGQTSLVVSTSDTLHASDSGGYPLYKASADEADGAMFATHRVGFDIVPLAGYAQDLFPGAPSTSHFSFWQDLALATTPGTIYASDGNGEDWRISCSSAIVIPLASGGSGSTETRTSSIAGTGSMVGVRKAEVKRSTTIAGMGSVTGEHKAEIRRTSTITAGATVEAIASKPEVRTTTTGGLAAVSPVAKAEVMRAATIGGIAAVSPVAKAATRHETSIAGQAAVSPIAKAEVTRTATIGAGATVNASGLSAAPTAATILAEALFLGQAKVEVRREASIAGIGDLAGQSKSSVTRTATISAGATVNAIATELAIAEATIAGSSSLVGIGRAKARSTTSILALASVSAVGRAQARGTSIISGAASVTALRKVAVTRTATISGNTSVTAYKGIEPVVGDNVNPIPNLPIGFPITGA
jgi:hypothetical protein